MSVVVQSLVTLRKDLISAEIDGDMVLMDVASGQYVAIGGPGALLTELLVKAPMSIGDLCAAARARYEVDGESCLSEIGEFVAKLQREGLATVTG